MLCWKNDKTWGKGGKGMDQVEFQYIQTNGIKLHTAMVGPKDGPLLVLLHGFPEFWYGWKNQILP